MEGLRRLQEAYGGVDALPTLDDGSHQPWYAEGLFMHYGRRAERTASLARWLWTAWCGPCPS